MTRLIYQEKKKEIAERVFRMGAQANDALRKALHAFAEGDLELARKVRQDDASIDRLQEEIDRTILTFIAIEQPVAHDLTELFASVKIVVELERLADHAAHIARAAVRLSRRPPEQVLETVSRMGTLCAAMLEEAMTAFLARDTAAAKETASRDDEVDRLHTRLIEGLLGGTDENGLPDTMQLLYTALYLERIGDHVTNICEWILYGANAEAIRLNE